MVVRQSERLEVRLDPLNRDYLRCLLDERGLTFADWIRAKIEDERKAEARRRALAAVERMAARSEEWVPADPEELRRMIDEEDEE